MSRFRIADLYCGAGGAAVGYQRAGFDVVGFDINPQPNYPFEFRQRDVMTLAESDLLEFDAFHASPPCQFFSRTHSIHRKGRVKGGNGGYKKPRERDARDDHPDLIEPTRELLLELGRPYIIENVQDAQRALIDPLTLCGEMFGLRVYRHRCFETNWRCEPIPPHPKHTSGITTGTGNSKGRGRGYSASSHGSQMITVAGNNFNRLEGMAAMGIDWHANQKEVAQMIPPAYTDWLGQKLMAQLMLS